MAKIAETATGYYVGPARSADEVTQARAVHSRSYVREGLVAPLSEGEVFDDGWMLQRQWLVVANADGVVGTASLICPKHSLPTLVAFDMRPQEVPRLASSWAQRRVFEVSALARDSESGAAPIVGALLYRALWLAHERRRDHDIWLMSMRARRLDRLCQLFPVPFELLGRADTYYNGASIACLLDLRLARLSLSLRAPALLAWLDGQHEDYSVLFRSRLTSTASGCSAEQRPPSVSV